ncbi:TPA: DUF2683 family protein [archaeon]|nr:DUF2683 family protein [Candidatus Naiadarchaeales archaeon SRR2090153.bin461]HIK02607.1 DUF2683 family protein [Candidatus Naiadarchaeales archaeon SRR2090159.bin1288]
MVKAIIDIDKRTNHLLNIVKAKYDLKDKSEAIERMAGEYEENILEPELKPEFIAEMKKRQKGRILNVPDYEKKLTPRRNV